MDQWLLRKLIDWHAVNVAPRDQGCLKTGLERTSAPALLLFGVARQPLLCQILTVCKGLQHRHVTTEMLTALGIREADRPVIKGRQGAAADRRGARQSWLAAIRARVDLTGGLEYSAGSFFESPIFFVFSHRWNFHSTRK